MSRPASRDCHGDSRCHARERSDDRRLLAITPGRIPGQPSSMDATDDSHEQLESVGARPLAPTKPIRSAVPPAVPRPHPLDLLPHADVDEGTQGGRLTGPEAPRVGMGW